MSVRPAVTFHLILPFASVSPCFCFRIPVRGQQTATLKLDLQGGPKTIC